jgi:hypothetical protein
MILNAVQIDKEFRGDYTESTLSPSSSMRSVESQSANATTFSNSVGKTHCPISIAMSPQGILAAQSLSLSSSYLSSPCSCRTDCIDNVRVFWTAMDQERAAAQAQSTLGKDPKFGPNQWVYWEFRNIRLSPGAEQGDGELVSGGFARPSAIAGARPTGGTW